jgi:hypothetical protein
MRPAADQGACHGYGDGSHEASLTSPRRDGFSPLLQCQSISKPLILLIRGAKNPSNSPNVVAN